MARNEYSGLASAKAIEETPLPNPMSMNSGDFNSGQIYVDRNDLFVNVKRFSPP
jgi:hypothetical protein